MGNRISHLQWSRTRDTGQDHSKKRTVTLGQPPCPTLPIKEPTQSFWTYPPSVIDTHHSTDNFPTHADVVIIGSGISGASFARTLLDIDQERDDDSDPLSVVMLEAQETCSGATGRNGGHINPPLFHDYEDLKRSLGKAAAQQIIRFRIAHLEVLPKVAEMEADDADCRKVHSVDVFFDETVFTEAKRKLGVFREDMPQEASSFRIWEGENARKRFNLSSLVVGCITTRAGAIHPYRFVTDILLRLLEEYPKYFQLFTQTPCTSIAEPSSSNPHYTLATPRGRLTASHVVHLTNAWVGGLVPGLANMVYRVRETMSAQRPGRALQFPAIETLDDITTSKNHGRRAYIFFDSPQQKGFDYLTQLSSGEHELMFGGGREAFLDADVEDDGPGRACGGVCRPASKGMYDVHSAAHVSGALPIYFGATNWGAEAVSAAETPLGKSEGKEGLGGDDGIHGEIRDAWAAGRVKALWSGVLSVSVDEFPWVGRIPGAISGRRTPADGKRRSGGGVNDRKITIRRMADPGEWVAAGYSGEGMVHAWLCSRALALMVLGLDGVQGVGVSEGRYGVGQSVEEWLPACYRINVARWKRAQRQAWTSSSDGGRVAVRGGAGKMKIYHNI